MKICENLGRICDESSAFCVEYRVLSVGSLKALSFDLG